MVSRVDCANIGAAFVGSFAFEEDSLAPGLNWPCVSSGIFLHVRRCLLRLEVLDPWILILESQCLHVR